MEVPLIYVGGHPESFPWIYERGDRPALVTSTLQALAVLMALKLYNKGNGSALNKLMSTKYPSSALLMELSAFLKHRKNKALVQWPSRVKPGGRRVGQWVRTRPQSRTGVEGRL